jgi:membrane associated rhomboid family serine protease
MVIRSKKDSSKDESFFSRRSAVVILIAITSIISIFGFILNAFYPNLSSYYSLKASNIFEGGYLWTLITHIFFHANIFHLLVNMFSLFFIGSIVEMIVGKKRFIWFYLISGVFAGIIYSLSAYLGNLLDMALLLGNLDIMAVGASGAIFGLLGILTILIPNKKVYLIAGPIILIILQVVLSGFISEGVFGIFSIIINILTFVMIFGIFMPNSVFYKFAVPIQMSMWFAPIAAIVPLVLVSLVFPLPIGNTAHIGGLIAGIMYGTYLKNKYPKKISLIRRLIR